MCKYTGPSNEVADQVSNDTTESNNVSNVIEGDFSGVNIPNGRMTRCESGYLEMCEGVDINNCSNWRAGNAQDLAKFKQEMIKGAEGMESGAKGMEQGAQSMRDSGMSSDSMMSGAESQRQGAKKMRWQAENCKVKG
jgi:hypothetical protein